MEKLFKNYPFLITPFQMVMTFLLYLQCSIIIGISAFPSVYLILCYWKRFDPTSSLSGMLGFSIALPIGFFLYMLVLIFIVPLVAFLFRLKIQEGEVGLYSLEALKWANYNSLILIVRFTCMNFLRVTPFLGLFHKMMGAKIGKNVQINTSVLADSSLIEIGDHSVIGGDATIIAHVAERKKLIIKKVKIGSHVTIGIMTIVMPGVGIGDYAMVAAHSVLPKDTQIPPNTIWGGVPARQIGERTPVLHKEPDRDRESQKA